MENLKLSRRTEPVMLTVRIDRSILDFYDRLALAAGHSRNELLGLALDCAKDKFQLEGPAVPPPEK